MIKIMKIINIGKKNEGKKLKIKIWIIKYKIIISFLLDEDS